jgi:choloylglycine hydrolase
MRAKDQSIIYARTLEFEPEASPEIVFIPRGHSFAATGQEGRNGGISWQSRYALAGIDGVGKKIILDGVNEKGLAAGIFYLPGLIETWDMRAFESEGSCPMPDISAWALSNCSTVKEVKQSLPHLWFEKGMGVRTEPAGSSLHYSIHDRLGNHLVIGLSGGKLNMYSTPAKAFESSPVLDWHMTHSGISNWRTAGSCFIRVAARSLSTMPLNNAEEAVLQAFCILHANTGHGEENSRFRTCVNDLQNRRFFFYTGDKRQIQVVDLMKMNLDGRKVVRFQA